jgi:hypothetical protein
MMMVNQLPITKHRHPLPPSLPPPPRICFAAFCLKVGGGGGGGAALGYTHQQSNGDSDACSPRVISIAVARWPSFWPHYSKYPLKLCHQYRKNVDLKCYQIITKVT